MIEDKGIQIKNIYYMLAYAYRSLNIAGLDKIAGESFDYIYDLFAEILEKEIARQLKQGLYREYIVQRESLPLLKGRIDMHETIQNRMRRSRLLGCEFSEYSEDNIYNQILKATIAVLVRCDQVNQDKRNRLKRELLFFQGVSYVDLKEIPWRKLSFNRHNARYQFLITICDFIIEGLLLTTDEGEYRLAQFLDDQKMNALFEHFVLEYYRVHYPELSPKPMVVNWNLESGDPSLLPQMKTDITISNGQNTLIIDTKYYGNILRKHFGKTTLNSSHLYQIFSYVNNYKQQYSGAVSGMLLYAKTTEEVAPDERYVISGNNYYVKCIDLNVEFNKIKAMLDSIAKNMLT